MSIESINKRIADEAAAFAEKCIQEAESQKKEILADARIKADKILENARVRAEKDSKILIERRESVAGLESRKMVLQAKQEVISECFDNALDKLVSMKEEDYLGFLEGLLKPFAEAGGEILLNESDKEKFGAKLAEKLGGSALTLAEEAAAIKGGAVLRQGDVSINCSIEKLLEDKKEEIMGEVARKLFPEN